MMNGPGQSDTFMVPRKPRNNAEHSAADAGEGRRVAKGNPREHTASRTQRRIDASSALARVREAADGDGQRPDPAVCFAVTTQGRSRMR